jgi:hypothetical protein
MSGSLAPGRWAVYQKSTYKMAYYPDLSEYSYMQECHEPNTYNIGWLEPPHKFIQGTTTTEFHERLLLFYSIMVCQTRGIHHCLFCPKPSDWRPIMVEYKTRQLWLGTAEIRVYGNEKIFAAPNLISLCNSTSI